MLNQDTIKILILGDSGVGKSTFVHSFINGYVLNKKIIYPTVGVDYESVNIMFKDIQYKIFFFDSSGQDKFKSLIPTYYKYIQCFIFMYDLTTPSSKDNIIKHMNDSVENLNKHGINFEDITSIIIANKYDLIHTLGDLDKNEIINQCKELADSTELDVLLSSSKQELTGFTSKSCIYHLINEHIIKTSSKIDIQNIPSTPKINIKKIKKETSDNCACVSQ